MANTKISALPAASALDGTELIPVVKAGVTSKRAIGQAVVESIPPGIYAPMRKGNRFIAIGDSITVGDKTVSGNVPTTPGPQAAYLTKDPLWWAQLLSNQKIVYYRNAGVLGDTTTMMLARFAADVIAFAPDWCHFLGGTNDINLGGANTFAVFQANVIAAWTMCKAANIGFVIGTIPPRITDALNKTTEAWNEWIRQWAAKNSIPLADYYNAMVDLTTGGMTTAYTHDGVHPSSLGAWTMGSVLAATMDAFVPTPGDTQARHNAAAAGNNLLTNGLFIGDSNADGLANNWTSQFAGTGTPTIVADSTIVGNWQRVTSTATGASLAFYQSLAVGSGIAVGDVLRISGLIQTSNPSGQWSSLGAGSVKLYDVTHAINNYLTPEGNNFAYLSTPFSLSTPARRFEAEYTVPAGATTLNLSCGKLSGATAGDWFQVAQLSVVNLTTMGIASRLAA